MFNPADYFLDVVSMDYRSPELERSTRTRIDRLAGKWEALQKPVLDQLQGQPVKTQAPPASDAHLLCGSDEYASSWCVTYHPLTD